MSKHKRTFRREYLVYPRFQMFLLAMNGSVFMVLAGFLALSARDSYSRLAHAGIQARFNPGSPFFAGVDAEYHHFISLVVFSLVASVAISSLVILWSSHKVVGPVLHLRSYFKNIVSRERSPRRNLRFRSTDCFEDMPAVVNGAIAILRAGAEEDDQTTSTVIRKYR